MTGTTIGTTIGTMTGTMTGTTTGAKDDEQVTLTVTKSTRDAF
ncbi:MAG TPA: hypothetical protein VHM88_09885 [Candidatus Acidoferrales bacterium]|nr:hypothetical protein [Candidatus Acidoferrales bacterium]